MDYYVQAQGPPASSSSAANFYVLGEQQQDPHEWKQQQQQQEHQKQVQVSSSSSTDATASLQEAMWHMSLEGGGGDHHRRHLQQEQQADQHEEPVVPYPERVGEPDCVYYMRTGMCAFGMTCRYNHPRNRKLAAAIARGKGEYPERPGQPECQFFLKTGTCKFGATCKYHHPRDKAGIQGRVTLNLLGFPLRMGEKECSYYMRTGSCKYGITCKFHHPGPIYGTATPTPSAAAAAAQATGWQLTAASARPYTPLLVSPSGWNSTVYPEGSTGGYVYGTSVAEHQQQQQYPERPGMIECSYYMKTGDCKFGSACRYHHPRERMEVAPARNISSPCILSSMGLPLRQGVQTCSYFARYGICKFGPTCKFDHPMHAILAINEVPPCPYPVYATISMVSRQGAPIMSAAISIASDVAVTSEATTSTTTILSRNNSGDVEAASSGSGTGGASS